MTDRFDLEQDIMNCWSVCDDLNMLLKSNGYDNSDIEAISRVYQRKFEALWQTFEDCIQNKFGYFPELPNSLGNSKQTYGNQQEFDTCEDIGFPEK